MSEEPEKINRFWLWRKAQYQAETIWQDFSACFSAVKKRQNAGDSSPAA
jgi:hypothetical protein